MSERFQDRAGTELRRGVLQVAVLALLRRRTYGYDLLRVLAEGGLTTEEGTLYPILRRLETEGLLTSSWDTSGNRPRKYYESTDEGLAVLRSLRAEWDRVDRSLRELCGEADAAAGTESRARNDNGNDDHTAGTQPRRPT